MLQKPSYTLEIRFVVLEKSAIQPNVAWALTTIVAVNYTMEGSGVIGGDEVTMVSTFNTVDSKGAFVGDRWTKRKKVASYSYGTHTL